MPAAFSRTLRSIEADRSRVSADHRTAVHAARPSPDVAELERAEITRRDFRDFADLLHRQMLRFAPRTQECTKGGRLLKVSGLGL